VKLDLTRYDNPGATSPQLIQRTRNRKKIAIVTITYPDVRLALCAGAKQREDLAVNDKNVKFWLQKWPGVSIKKQLCARVNEMVNLQLWWMAS
jgi:hypothetical protein